MQTASQSIYGGALDNRYGDTDIAEMTRAWVAHRNHGPLNGSARYCCAAFTSRWTRER